MGYLIALIREREPNVVVEKLTRVAKGGPCGALTKSGTFD